jgi:hypothetical protein
LVLVERAAFKRLALAVMAPLHRLVLFQLLAEVEVVVLRFWLVELVVLEAEVVASTRLAPSIRLQVGQAHRDKVTMAEPEGRLPIKPGWAEEAEVLLLLVSLQFLVQRAMVARV